MTGADGAAPRDYLTALQRLQYAQKPGAGEPAYLRWINRPLGRRVAARAYAWGLAPDTLTWLSAGWSFAAFALIAAAPAQMWVAVAATALLVIGYAFDSADGQLARLAGQGSSAGEWLDHVVDAARIPLLHIAIASSFFLRPDASTWLVVAALAFAVVSSVWFFASILAAKLAGPSTHGATPHAPVWVSFVKLPNDIGFLYLCILTLPILWLFSSLYLALLGYTVMAASLSLWRKHQMLRSRGTSL